MLQKLKSKIKPGTRLWKIYLVLCRPIKVYKKIRFYWVFSKILKTIPFKCNPNAETEIHSLTCHKHLYMYLLAIKSFLRFYNNVAVVMHDDGTLSKKDVEKLKKHIKNIKIINNNYSNKIMNNTLKKYLACYKFRINRVITRQAFDFGILAKKNKMILMDSDILFLEHPKKIIKWIESKKQEILYVYEKNPSCPTINGTPITCLKDIPFKLTNNLCGGFVCCYKKIFNLDLMEKYCRYVIKNCNDKVYQAQTITALCVKNSKYKLKMLLKEYQNRENFQENAIFRHYWFSDSILKEYYMDAKNVLNDIRN